MQQHGFARNLDWSISSTSADPQPDDQEPEVTLLLTDNEYTRKMWWVEVPGGGATLCEGWGWLPHEQELRVLSWLNLEIWSSLDAASACICCVQAPCLPGGLQHSPAR